MSIDNDRDLNEHILAQHRNMPLGVGEVKYERNPVSFVA